MLSHVCADAELKMVNYAISNLSKELSQLEPSIDEWFSKVQERKELCRSKTVLEAERRKILPPKVKNFEDKVVALKEKSRASSSPAYENKTEVTANNSWRSIRVMEAWSGFSKDSIKSMIDEEFSETGNLTTATRNVWQRLPLRSDKPIVSIDLEVAAPLLYGAVDMGVASSIIEVGYIKITPDGEISSENYLCGVEREYEETIGTGAVDVHNITLDMVSGCKPFSMDVERQKSLLAALRGSVIIAHNADYEVSQFSSSLPGFAKMLQNGEVEILDTKMVVKYLIGGIERNTNEAFVEITGGKYEGAHRALDDALMTLNALFRSKGMAEISL